MRFKAIQIKGMDAALAEARLNLRPTEPEIEPALAAGIERDFHEKHYREWLDTPVPALGNRTPRAAALDPKPQVPSLKPFSLLAAQTLLGLRSGRRDAGSIWNPIWRK